MEENPRVKRAVAILWPSFIMAGIATILFFTFFDPAEFLITTPLAGISRLGAYTIGFFGFWLLMVGATALSCYFQQPLETQRHDHH